jgi:hypothetical protein
MLVGEAKKVGGMKGLSREKMESVMAQFATFPEGVEGKFE